MTATRPATKREIATLNEITDQLTELAQKHGISLTAFALSRTLPMLWCTNRRVTTVTEALDLWRELNAEMEDTIRRNFGTVRYGK